MTLLRSAVVRWLCLILVGVVAATGLAGCASSSTKDTNKPALDLPVADDTVTALAAALSTMKLDSAPLTSSASTAQAEATTIMSGMDSFLPTVTVLGIDYSKDIPDATARLHYAWPFPSGAWTYDVSVPLEHNGQGWKAVWSPTVIHPQLTADTRLVHTLLPARRAGITGNGGTAIVDEYRIVRVGIDKTLVPSTQWDASARSLAAIVGVNPDAYAAQVASAGEKAFVVAVTLRQGAVPSQVATVAGARGVEDTSLLPPTSDFAREILGVIGEASPQDVAASKGAIQAGDTVGKTGLQKRYDAQLRGTPGDRITLTPRKKPSAAPSPASGGSAAPSTGTSVSATPAASLLYTKDPVAGTPLQLSLDLDLQTKAEQVMSTVPGPAAAAIVRPSDGAILAAATSPGSGDQPDATFGQYPPGSTFKIATSLALIRKGLTPDSTLNCTATTKVDDWPFKNYSDFPSSKVGRIPLKDAVASSCNTAFINEFERISGDDLIAAAASLGVGVDYDAGAPMFYGKVPKPDSTVKKAQQFIGQGGVLASPVAMAGLASSVSAGRTTIPWLVASQKPTSTAAPLTADEAASLRTLMEYTVAAGSGRVLQGVAQGAKTGTAEYGTGATLPTHAWMIAYTANDLAVAVWVKDGASGSGTAGPIIKSLLG